MALEYEVHKKEGESKIPDHEALERAIDDALAEGRVKFVKVGTGYTIAVVDKEEIEKTD